MKPRGIITLKKAKETLKFQAKRKEYAKLLQGTKLR